MKSSSSISDIVDSRISCLIKEIEQAEDNFGKLVKTANLDPTTDFCYSNLTGVDFSNSDLRNFNFYGADLRYSFGENVIFDKTTNLQNAAVASSIFSYSVKESELFESYPNIERKFNLINNNYWSNTIDWIMKNTKKGGTDADFYIARKLVVDNKNPIVRSHALLLCWRTFNNKELYRDFILHLLAKHGADVALRRTAVQALGKLFGSDLVSYLLLKKYLDDSDYRTRRNAFKAVISSGLFKQDRRNLMERIKTEPDSDLRRLAAARLAKILSDRHLEAIQERGAKLVLDFNEIITRERLAFIARRDDIFLETNGSIITLNKKGLSYLKIEEIKIYQCITELAEEGLPFKFDDEIIKLAERIS